MSNLIKKLENRREIRYLLSLREYLSESRNYYDGKIIKYGNYIPVYTTNNILYL